MESKLYDIVILGSGPAGLTAALYASRSERKTLIVAGIKYGGQLMLTTEVENYPGFPQGILGPELMEKMIEQAKRFGTEIINDDATSVNFEKNPFEVSVSEKIYRGRSVIIATGAVPKLLSVPGEEKLMGRGVSTCAPCDAPLFKNKVGLVVGGGDSAMEEALYLSKFAEKVTVVHRRDKLKASKIMQQRAFANKKISFIWDSIVEEILGDQKVTGVKINNLKTEKEEKISCDAVFIAIGHLPNTEILKGHIELDKKGYVVVKNHTQTNVLGVFVAGDVHDHVYRQVATAVGFGCMAAMDAEKYLEEGDNG